MSEPLGTSPVTLRDIARRLDISHAAVSLALHNSPGVSPLTRRRVHQTALEMGYQRNPMAAALALNRHSSGKRIAPAKIAWINFWSNPGELRHFREFELYWEGACAAAENHGYQLEEFICGDHISPAQLEQMLLSHKIQGILIPPHDVAHGRPDWGQINWEKFCAVRFGYSVSNLPVHVAASNYLNTGLLALKNMVRLGYKRIGYVTTLDYVPLFRAGFCGSQIDPNKVELLPILYLKKNAGNFAEPDLLSQWLTNYRPDAILTDIGELREMLKTLGYRVPQDIGLAATSVNDGNAEAGIDQNSLEIGKAAVDILVALLHSYNYGIPTIFREVLVTGKWIDGSSLPPRG